MSQPSKTPPKPDEEDLPEFEDRAKPFLWKMAMIFCLVMAILLAIKPTFHRLNRQKGIAAADAADSLSLAQKPQEAAKQLKIALELAPQVPKVIRTAAQVLTRHNDPHALEFWQALLTKTSEGSREDRLKYVEFALSLGRTDLTGPELESMLRVNPRDEAARRLLIQHTIARKDLNGAIDLARGWVTDAPADAEAQLVLGQLLEQHPEDSQRSEGRRVLLALAGGRGSTRDAAANLLANDPNLDPNEAQQLLRILEARQGNQIVDRLRIVELKLRQQPGSLDELVEDLSKRASGSSDDELLVLSAWLQIRGQHAAVVRVLPAERAQAKSALLVARLQSLSMLGKTAEVEPVLADSKAPLNDFQRNLLRAVLASRQTPPTASLRFLRAAMDAAGSSQENLANIANLAASLRETNALIEAHARLISFPTQAPTSSLEVMRLLESVTDTRSARDLARDVAARVPGVRLVAAEAAYCDLLLKEGVDEARARLNEFVAAEPQNTRFRLALALAEWLQGKPASAMALVGSEKLDWNSVGWRWQALRAAVLAANDQVDAAKAAAKTIETAGLHPEEVDWLKSLK